jgi:hypothetical protein
MYSPLRTFAPFPTGSSSSLLFICCLHLFNLSYCKSFSAPSSHPNLGPSNFSFISPLLNRLALTEDNQCPDSKERHQQQSNQWQMLQQNDQATPGPL